MHLTAPNFAWSLCPVLMIVRSVSLVSEHYLSVLTLQSTRTRLRRAGYLGR